MTVSLFLSQGYVAIIDDADSHLSNHKWHAKVTESGLVYAARNVTDVSGRQRTVKLHRAVMGLNNGDPIVDHINGNTLDNRRTNLRVVSGCENQRNISGPRKNSTTGFLGVVRSGKKYRARIKIDGVLRYFGSYSTAEEANVARLLAEREHWGVHPRRKAAFDALNQYEMAMEEAK